MKTVPCKVFAPATVANVAVGYDILGFAINGIGDEVLIRKGSKPGLVISNIRGNKTLSKDPQKNTAGYCALKVMEHLGLENEPIEIELLKKMPIGTGLGSSAASSVAGAYAVNAYLDYPLKDRELLRFATMGEQLADGSFHADNVAPSLLGGFILIRDNTTLDHVRLPSIPGLKAVVIYPHITVLTRDSRAILKDHVALETHVAQSGNLAAFVSALFRSDIELLRRSLTDNLIEPQRASLIPGFYKMKEAALDLGALGFSISGAGPSMFALCMNTFDAENIIEKAKTIYRDQQIDITCYLSDINLEGAKKY